MVPCAIDISLLLYMYITHLSLDHYHPRVAGTNAERRMMMMVELWRRPLPLSPVVSGECIPSSENNEH